MIFVRRYILLLVLGFVFILSAVAYLYIPDNTIDANKMYPELALQKPGFKIILLDTNKAEAPQGNIFMGYVPKNTAIPISSFFVKNKVWYCSLYKGKGITGDTLMVNKTNIQMSKKVYVLGSDIYGRDVLSRLILGMRNSLIIGLLAVFVSLIVGVGLGVTAGYYSHTWDNIVMWIINVIWSLPTLLIVFALTLALGKGFWQVFLAIGLTMWVETARVVRTEAMSLRHRDFVTASYVSGRSNSIIIIKHIVPNIWPVIWVLAANNFASAMLIESGLSFLGLGIQPPAPTLGSLIRENYGFIVTQHAFLAFVPGVTLMILVLLFYRAGVSLKAQNFNNI